MRLSRAAASLSLAATALACRDPAHAPNAHPIADAAVHTICTSELGGAGAKLQVWRETDGTFVIIELLADPSHGAELPDVFFDDDGRETMRISSQSATPSSPEALEAGRRRDLATRDGVKAEKILCQGR